MKFSILRMLLTFLNRFQQLNLL